MDDDIDDDNNDDGGGVIVSDVCNKITRGQAEQYIQGLKQYIEQSGAPTQILDSRLVIATQLRAHNASKPRNNPTLYQFFKKTNK